MTFSSKGVLVTGASRGIGKVVAQQFAGNGAKVAVHYHQNEKAANSTLASLAGGPSCGPRAMAGLRSPPPIPSLISTNAYEPADPWLPKDSLDCGAAP